LVYNLSYSHIHSCLKYPKLLIPIFITIFIPIHIYSLSLPSLSKNRLHILALLLFLDHSTKPCLIYATISLFSNILPNFPASIFLLSVLLLLASLILSIAYPCQLCQRPPPRQNIITCRRTITFLPNSSPTYFKLLSKFHLSAAFILFNLPISFLFSVFSSSSSSSSPPSLFL